MDDRTMWVLLLWGLCVLSILGALFRLLWFSTSLERLLALGLCLLTAASLRRKGRN